MIRIAQAPTPLIMWTVKNLGLPYGMAVTASHNPALYNGIKVFTAGGRDADEVVTRDIEDRMTKLEAPARPGLGRCPTTRPSRGD